MPSLLKDLRMDPNREFNPDKGPKGHLSRDLVSLEAFMKELMMKHMKLFMKLNERNPHIDPTFNSRNNCEEQPSI